MHAMLTRIMPVLGILLIASPSPCDRLTHTDGTVIEGEIVNQTEDTIMVKTKYGTLRYQRMDILRIEKDGASPSTAITAQTSAQPKSLLSLIPAGPINPLAPPNLPSLAQYHQARPAAAPAGAPTASVWTTTGSITSLADLAITE